VTKGRKVFSHQEANSIKQLLFERGKSTPPGQRKVRDRLRKIGFYITDFDRSGSGFAPEAFDRLVVDGLVKISGSPKEFAPSPTPRVDSRTKSNRGKSDEEYVLDLCDEVLGVKAKRQHRFSFLVGDSGSRLPVDAYYEQPKLVVEYRERQHSEPVNFFDKRETVSGVNRGTQRKIYDQRRREVLPREGIALVELSYAQFEHDSKKRIVRNRDKDLKVVLAELMRWLPK